LNKFRSNHKRIVLLVNMAGFLKSLAKAAGNAIDISHLDGIVEDLTKEFDRCMSELSNSSIPLSEVSGKEEELIQRLLDDYDKRLKKDGESVQPNWVEGGGSNNEVRKRMLNRNLQRKRGKVHREMEGRMEVVKSRVDSLVAAVEDTTQKYLTELTTSFPMAVSRNQATAAASSQVAASIEAKTFQDSIETQIPSLVRRVYEDRCKELQGVAKFEEEHVILYGKNFWDQTWKVSYDARVAELEKLNDEAIKAYIKKAKEDIVAGMKAEMQAAMIKIHEGCNEKVLNLPLLTDEQRGVLLQQLASEKLT
jgi:division protein CdvB (Snf7/Vps24/ESCRT-III family)